MIYGNQKNAKNPEDAIVKRRRRYLKIVRRHVIYALLLKTAMIIGPRKNVKKGVTKNQLRCL